MKVVFFDGVCNLCNASVRFLKKYDKLQIFEIHSLQSEQAQILLKPHFSGNLPDSIVYFNNNQVFTESDAVFEILWQLPFPWKLLYVFKLTPKFLRNSIYRYIARNRYKWFGKCHI
jgi:predicted DCC family thiol-disulfide oxidoreductase YuxK